MRRHWLLGRSVASSLLCDGESIGPIFRDEIMKYKKNPRLVATALPTATKIIHSKMKFCQLKKGKFIYRMYFDLFFEVFSAFTPTASFGT